MGFDFKKVITAVAPMIGTALGGPLGGAAATQICTKLGLNVPNPADEAAVAKVVTPLLNDPEILLKLKEADNEFTVTMTKLNIDSVTKMAELDVQDRASARSRETQVRDYTPEAGFYLLIFTFGFFLHWLVKYPVPTENRAIIYSAFGSLGTLVVMAATYFYGSTRQSGIKSDLLATSVPSDVVKDIADATRQHRLTDTPQLQLKQ